MPYLRVLLISKVRMEDLNEEISHFKQNSEGSEGDFVDDKNIIEESIWLFVN